jgi:hypothetical protein
VRRILPFLLIASCKGTCQHPSPTDDAAVTQDAANDASVPDATIADAPVMDAATDAAALVTIHRVSGCTIALDAPRAPTREEILALLFPNVSLATLELPPNPLDGGGFGVPMCNDSEETVWHQPRRLGALTRVAYGADREVVQVSYGVGGGMVDLPVGVIALIERSGATVRATAFYRASGTSGVSANDDGPYALAPIRKASFGATNTLFIESPDATWTESSDGGALVTVLIVRAGALKLAGSAFVSHRSNGIFWHGPMRWSMTSAGMESQGDGYVVHEHWTFTNRTTKKQSTRDVMRTYRLDADHLVATPRVDLETWPETRDDLDADTPGDEDPAAN